MAMNPFTTARTSRIGLAWPALVVATLLAASGARAQSVPAPAAPPQFTPAELQTLVGPIALYVDDLIGIVLPASAYPLQVVQATRFLDARAQDPSLSPDETWDDSVVALLNYPEVLRMMDQNLDWTAHLGEAFVYQQMELLQAIQQFRVLAQSAGNLSSNAYQTVSNNSGAITVAPANPQVIYVPYYEPVRVVNYYSTPVVRYYPYGYPVYDYPYPYGYSFRSGFFWGVTTAFVLNWHTHYVYVYPHHYSRHPYYGRRYHSSYYVRHYQPRRYQHRDYHDNVWRPNDRWGTHPRRYDDRRDRHTHADRQLAPRDPRGSGLAPSVASSPRSSRRAQWDASHEDRQRSPAATGSGNQTAARNDGNRTPAADTTQRPQATHPRNIQRMPLKPPRTVGTTSPAPVSPAAPRPAVGGKTPRVVGTPGRSAPPAVRTPPTRSVPVQVAPARTPANAAGRQPAVNPRVAAQMPRAAPPAASDGMPQAAPRPPKASASAVPPPARQPKNQQAAKQGKGARSAGRGKSGA
jgi:hypothetical protein